jgi:hypothetical protein
MPAAARQGNRKACDQQTSNSRTRALGPCERTAAIGFLHTHVGLSLEG